MTNPTKPKNERIYTGDTLHLTKCADGFWLWDETRGMNLAMRAETEQAAFIDALDYYQKRLLEVEGELKNLNKSVDDFVSKVRPNDGEVQS